jgi:hypothetical protein
LWNHHLPNIQPHYAVKCNNDEYLLTTLAKAKVNFDCASHGEIKQILNLEINQNRIIYANPYKSKSDIEYALSKNIPLTVVDSIEELEKLRDKNIEILIRVKVNDKDSLMPFSSKFGASYEEIIDILKLAKKYNMNISGFSFHVGSGCYNSNQYYEAVKTIYDIIGIVPEFISTYNSRKFAFPELVKENDKKKHVLFGGLPKDIDKKMVIWELVAKREPQIQWQYTRNNTLKKENFDQTDAYACVLGYMRSKGIWQ